MSMAFWLLNFYQRNIFNYKNIRINPFREEYKEAVIRDIKKENNMMGK